MMGQKKRHGAWGKGMALQEKGMAQHHSKRALGKHYFILSQAVN